jgi:uncharacterized protein involved in exopolysaccharide biosynthesis
MTARPPHGETYDEAPEAPPGPTLFDWIGLVMRAAGRRKLLGIAVFAVGLSATLAYYRFRTPIYRVETKILAQRQQALPSIVRGGGDDAPTRTAWELVHRRENLISLIQETEILPRTGAPKTGDPPMLLNLRFGRPPEEDPLSTAVLMLDRALVVTTDEGTITIRIDWPNPDQAYRIVGTALQNFLEARHLQEVTAIDEVISVLQGRVATLRAQLEREIEEARSRSVPRSSEPSAHAVGTRGQPSEEVVRLKTMLDAKERAILDVEEFRRRRLADLQAQLDEKRGIYSDAHPSVISLRRDIEALSRDSAQIAQLREEERALRKDYAAKLAQEVRLQPAPAGSRVAQQASTASEEPDGVREARLQYQAMIERVNAAQLELDAARAAFKYRYNVIWPAERPKKPISPRPVKVFGAGVLASLLLAVLAAAAADLAAGRILLRWQVERALHLPVLGEIEER